MTNTNSKNHRNLSRRDALKGLVAAGGATALSVLPKKWETPLVQVGELPVLAQTSPSQYPFSNEIEEITFEGADANSFQVATDIPGWLVVAPAGSVVGREAAAARPDHHNHWIKSRPWLGVTRSWGNVDQVPWAGVIKLKIKMKFFALPGFLDDDVPVDDTELWSYVLSGFDLSNITYYVSKVKMKKRKIEITILLPALVPGTVVWPFYPFFISFFFPFPIFLLSGGGTSLFPGYYVGPGIFGDKVKSSFLR